MKKTIVFVLLCLIVIPVLPENRYCAVSNEPQQSIPQWIYSLEFRNRQTGQGWGTGEMYFPENATVIFMLAAPSVGPSYSSFKYYIGNNSYYVSVDMGDQYISMNIDKGTTLKVRVERNGITGGTPARLTTTEVNGYYWRPYPIVV